MDFIWFLRPLEYGPLFWVNFILLIIYKIKNNCLFILAFVLFHAGTTGVTAGSHRLWSHRSYKAKWPLRLLLVAMQTLAFQVI